MSTRSTTFKFDVIGNDECLVLTSIDCTSSDKIAAYDLDQTLIRTKSVGPFPTDIFDWQMNNGSVIKKLQDLHGSGFKIVVFTNQAFIQFGTFTVGDIRDKFVAIQKKINVPMQFFAAGAFNVYRKPRIGM
jgi:bifunctional polynucleotide phosphatase/kinase